MNDLFQLVFLSRSDHELTEDELYRQIADIHDVSVRNNPNLGITGAMLWTDGYYCQVLEGPNDTLEDRFAIIQADKRHTACKILRYDPIEERRFTDQPLHVLGVFWEPVPGLATALHNLGTISSSEAAQAVVEAILHSAGAPSSDVPA